MKAPVSVDFLKYAVCGGDKASAMGYICEHMARE